ncbi:MAG: DEAD/DEAH box helicase, partial [Chloroflexi bacterium]|nr:DEAD/DEAH box helicase [Chloroflexota bacterium]
MLDNLIKMWKTENAIRENIVGWFVEEAHSSETLEFPAGLNADLKQTLFDTGISSLYSHQMEAWQSIKAGAHTVLVTGTASGKSLAYNLPILDNLLDDEQATALYLFPTKALTGDQFTGLSAIIPSQVGDNGVSGPRLPLAVYDGDTPSGHRSQIRGSARLLLSNPDMVHLGILPYHTSWERFFRGLRYVVIDEMHTYRGVFGSHFANVIRRLKRIANHYGAKPIFV